MNSQSLRFSLFGLFFFSALIILPIGWISAFGVIRGLAVSIAIYGCTCLLNQARGHQYFSIALAWHAAIFVGVYLFPALDALVGLPYAQWYSQRMIVRAEDSRLIGDGEDSVELLYGKPYALRRSSDDHTSSYYYSPYPHLPFPMALFRVHCTDGRVDWIEKLEELEDE